MAGEAPEQERKGYFARRRERRRARKEARAAALAGGPEPAAAAPARPPPTPTPEPRVSLALMEEVERRVDRLDARERRRRLLERYEAKYGEKLVVPEVFLPVEVVEETAPAERAAVSGAPQPSAQLEAQGQPAGPAPQPPAPAGAPIAAGPPAPATIAIGQPSGQAPGRPRRPSPINRRSFWKYLWPYWRFPLHALARYYRPESRGVKAAALIADAFIWILLILPRVVLFPIGFVIDRLKKRKAGRAPAEVAQAAD